MAAYDDSNPPEYIPRPTCCDWCWEPLPRLGVRAGCRFWLDGREIRAVLHMECTREHNPQCADYDHELIRRMDALATSEAQAAQAS